MSSRRPVDSFAASMMLVLCAIWGTQQVAIKLVAEEMSPLLQVGMRSGIAAAIVAIVAMMRNELGWFRAGTWKPGLVVGAAIGVAGFALLALLHSTAWQVIGAGILINAYISLSYGALPALVVQEVEAGETAVATSINAIARTVGASLAAAVVAVLLSHTGAAGHPAESSFTAIFALGAVTGLIALVLIAASRPRLRRIESVQEISQSRAMSHEWG